MASEFSPETSVALAFALAVFLSNSHLSSSASPRPLLPDGDDYDITQSTSEKSSTPLGILMLIFAAIVTIMFMVCACAIAVAKRTEPNVTILTIQVMLSDRAGDIGSVLLDIFRVNSRTQSQTPILKGTIDALLKHQKSFIYGSTSVQVIPQEGDIWNMDIMKKQEKQLRIQRARLDNGQRVPMLAPKQKKDNTLVIIMVATDGVHKLPSIHNSEGVKEALNYLDTKLAIIHAAHVVWSYQDPLLLQELLEICPDLNSIYD